MARKTLEVKKYYSKNFGIPALQIGTGEDKIFVGRKSFYSSFKKFRRIK